MIIPSIDIMGGQAVQLVGGERLALEAGDPFAIAEKFSLVGEIAVIDLDAARGQGSNREIIESLVARFDCRVGGGIRDEEAALRWLDAGAAKIILGTAATSDLLVKLPRERVMAAVDCRNGVVVDHGWQSDTGILGHQRITELRPYVSGFLVTFVEREGGLGGMDLDQVRDTINAAGEVPVTVAGGVAQAEEIGQIHALGADVQVGMALYTKRFTLGEALWSVLHSDRPDGLVPTVVCDERGVALGLAYSSATSLDAAIESRSGVYQSRKRGLWRKGETSGLTQKLLRIDVDCDSDALRFTVRQVGEFCHLGTRSCWGEARGLDQLERTIRSRMESSPAGSYTHRLLTEDGLLKSKLLEEAAELVDADSTEEVIQEMADLIYFATVKLYESGGSWSDAERVLDRRALKVFRRPGDRK